MTQSVETALDSLLQTAGLGGLGPNTAAVLWPDRWQSAPTGAKRMKQILMSAHAYNMALILLKVPPPASTPFQPTAPAVEAAGA